ncbi:MAG TPA: hypothetical protein VK614_11805 [Allosphingosinicella sp.]|nr:hypothetical protein [Allosphingosinicella sp.]
MAAAALAGALTGLAAPAAAQTPCGGGGWGQVDITNYSFSYLSRSQGQGSAAVSIHCVRNTHASRGVWVEWRGAGLSSVIPPGRTIFRTSPLAGRPRRRIYPFFYGARPNEMAVATVAALERPLPDWLAPAPAAALLRRAAYWQDAGRAPAARAGSNESLVYLPVARGLVDGFVRDSRPLAQLIESLERYPNLLQPFGMTFNDRVAVDGRGRTSISYLCRYRLPAAGRTDLPTFYLRFSDAALHRLMFRQGEPLRIDGWGGGETVLEASVAAPGRGRLAARNARLEVLLGDRRTVIASLPVAFSAPAS